MPTEERPELSATSVDGRHFVSEIPVARLELRVGGYVVIGDRRSGERLAYVTGMQLVERGRHSARVEGRVLEGPEAPFGEAPTRVAAPEEVARWLDAARPPRAALEVGSLTFAEGVPLALDAGAFDRHTFLCGQSGSGKTYALGTILERLLVETSLRIVVLDPNSDFVRLAELRDGIGGDVDAQYAAAAAAIEVRRAGDTGPDRLHVRFRDFDASEQAAVLRLDPIGDREEYAALAETLERSVASEAGTVREVVDQMRAAPDPVHSLGVRARNLGVDRWQIWSGDDAGSLEDLVQPGGPRCVVADLGSLAARGGGGPPASPC